MQEGNPAQMMMASHQQPARDAIAVEGMVGAQEESKGPTAAQRK